MTDAWVPTHRSTLDGSTVRVVGLWLENENGDRWVEQQVAEWAPIETPPCPYVRTSDEGTSYCSLGTA